MKKPLAKKVTLETLAGMVAKGFAEQENKLTGKIDGVESRLTERIDGVESRLSQQITGINNRIDNSYTNQRMGPNIRMATNENTRFTVHLLIGTNSDIG